MVGVEVTVAVASPVVHQEKSQRACVLSHKGACLSEIRQVLHASALKEVAFSRQGHSPKGPNVGLSEGQQLPCVQPWHLKYS